MGGWAEGVRFEPKVEQDSVCPLASGRLTHQALPGERVVLLKLLHQSPGQGRVKIHFNVYFLTY